MYSLPIIEICLNFHLITTPTFHIERSDQSLLASFYQNGCSLVDHHRSRCGCRHHELDVMRIQKV